jgi:hypothetical protein
MAKKIGIVNYWEIGNEGRVLMAKSEGGGDYALSLHFNGELKKELSWVNGMGAVERIAIEEECDAVTIA